MSGDVSRVCDIIAHELARIHVSYYNDDAKRDKGMYRQRIQKAGGHTAHRGWARLLLDRTRDLIIHGKGTTLWRLEPGSLDCSAAASSPCVVTSGMRRGAEVSICCFLCFVC